MIGTYRTTGSAARFSGPNRMDPPPQREPRRFNSLRKSHGADSDSNPDEPREHHGLWLGVFIGALLGLLIGSITLLAFELNRRDALEEVKEKLGEVEQPSREVVATETAKTAPVENGMGERVLPGDSGQPAVASDAPASLMHTTPRTRSTLTTEPGPTVLGSSPADGGVDIKDDMDLSLTFSEPMQPSSLTMDTVVVYENGKNISDHLKYDYNSETNRLEMRLLGKTFGAGAQVEIRVTPRVQSQKGVPFERMQTISFTIAS